MKNSIANAIWIAAFALLLAPQARAYRASDFNWLPPVLAMEEKPSLTFILDTSSSMLQRAYRGPFDTEREYHGYFDPHSSYSYNAQSDRPHFFADNATGEWSGNFLNWTAMLRIDLARKLLTGGRIDAQSGCLEFEPLGHGAEKFAFNATELTDGATPLRGTVTITARDGEGLLLAPETGEPYALRVKAEGENAGGLLQAMKNKARVALFTFEEGGQIKRSMGDDIDGVISAVNSVRPQGIAPLAKTLHEVYEYLRQNRGRGTRTDDPFYFSSRGQMAPCSKQSVILVSAGESSGDGGIPDKFKNLVARPRPEEDYATHPGGSTYLIDMAYLGHVTDLRPEEGMDGMQNWDFYAVCLADDSNPLLLDAAMHGKFRDVNGNNLPDLEREFDADRDGLPDSFFTAQSGLELKTALTRALLPDTPGVASGTATAVTALSRDGAGAAYQAVFFPPGRTGHAGPPWSGQVHAYFVDAQGNLREDTNADKRLEETIDRIIAFGPDGITAHADANGNGVLDEGENATVLHSLTGIRFLWRSSDWLNSLTDEEAVAQRSRYACTEPKRYIMTFVDKNQNLVADESDGEIQDFALPANPSAATLNSTDFFYNYLTLYESASKTLALDLSDPAQNAIHKLRAENPAQFAQFQAALAKRQVDFIRGVEVGNATFQGIGDSVRSRMRGAIPWRLGDIVNSSPVVVGKPAENYHLIYNDRAYEKFLKKYLHRRQVVYVGANDGMLHAFNGGFWNPGTRSFDTTREGRTGFALGQELWAYVPYNLLAHLGWLMHPDYGEKLHVAYMDLPPRAFDARIFVMSDGVTSVDEAVYPGGWGTILVAGMRLGGAAMEVDINKTDGDTFKEGTDRVVSSAYVIMDITDPESEPKVLGEITLPGQGFTTCVSAIMPMGSLGAENLDANKWHLVFGSGPADAAGRADSGKLMLENSDQAGSLFMLDLSALFMEQKVRISKHVVEPGSFISDPVCVDLDIGAKNGVGELSTDLVYFGTVAGDSSNPAGKIYRLRTYGSPPEDWKTSTLVDVREPVSAAPSVAVDEKGSLWIYFGTGRLLSHDDIPQTRPMSFYGIREPETDGVRNWNTVDASNLFDSSAIHVSAGICGEEEFSQDCVGITQTVDGSNATRDWAWLSRNADSAPGWKHTFPAAWERVLTPPAVLGGTVLFTTYTPSGAVCASEGTSRLWSLFYKTGTEYFWPSLDHAGGHFHPFTELGPGQASWPILHIGENPSLTAFTSLTSGEIADTEIDPALPFKSGSLFWRKNTD